jgi:hypothetical protein
MWGSSSKEMGHEGFPIQKTFLAGKNHLQQLFELTLTVTLSLLYTLYRKEYSSSESVIAQGFRTSHM